MAIEYAERIAEAPRDLPLDDEFWQRLRAAFDEAEIVDLTYSITTWIATGRFTHVLGFDGSCDVSLRAGRDVSGGLRPHQLSAAGPHTRPPAAATRRARGSPRFAGPGRSGARCPT